MADIMDEPSPSKRQRSFIARQACDACRARKTRCDEGFPCHLCKSLGIECKYGARKATKNEISLGMIFNTLKRMEGQLEDISTRTLPKTDTSESPVNLTRSAPASSASNNEPLLTPGSSTPGTRVSFSAHRTLDAIEASPCPLQIPSVYHHLSIAASELYRPALHTDPSAGIEALDMLSLSTIKELSNVYFATFNRIYPVVDRDFYFAYTLNLVTQDGFDYNVESCLVLMVMALGCLGKKAYEDGRFVNPQSRSSSSETADIRRFMEEGTPGLSLMAESLKRIGYSICENSLQSCGYYLLCASFYEQMARPMDEWSMINRACSVCAVLWKCESHNPDDWRTDMLSKLLWTCLLRESIISHELEMTPSGLQELDSRTPLPRFVKYTLQRPKADNHDDSYYHFHFLAQLALRIILSRIRNELYFTDPSPFVAEELLLQLYQWRDNLPLALQFADGDVSDVAQEPAEAVARGLLRTRYTVAVYHLSRPFLLKAIRSPEEMTESDLRLCSKTMPSAINWPLATGVCRKLKTFMPVKYFACKQIFGQVLFVYALKSLNRTQLIENLPGYPHKCRDLIKFVSEIASDSPSIAQDLAFLKTLFPVEDTLE